ncbi:1842_t:CDS:2, partial [Entrophospora sp. SA101]
SLVSFGAKQRYLGEAAKTQEISNFKNTVASLKRLAGRTYLDKEIQDIEKQFINADLVDAKGQVGVKVQYLGEEKIFSATQMISMYFTKLKEITTAELKIPISDVVISVPGWFTDVQRRSILDAAEVAGLNCLRLMNDTTASALGYGITKPDLPEDKPRNVVIVDIGHSTYSVAIVAFIKGQLTVKSTAGVDDNDNNNTSTHSVIPKISLRKPQDEDKQTLRKKGGHLVSSIHTNESGSDNNTHDDNNMSFITADGSSSPSQLSEGSGSIVSYPNSENIDSLVVTPEISYQDEHEREVLVMPAPGETLDQILAPLNIPELEIGRRERVRRRRNDDGDESDDDESDEKSIPPTYTIATNITINQKASSDEVKPLSSSQSYSQALNFQNQADNNNTGEMILTIFQHQILFPFLQGFSWGIGVHIYRYLRNGFTLRNMWRSIFSSGNSVRTESNG